MENKMKKLIALFAVSTIASTSAIAGVALSGSASVSYDDNGSAGGSAGKSVTTYDADITLVGTTGATTFTYSMDVDRANPATTAADMSSTIGPITIAADMFNVVESTLDDGYGDAKSN